MDALESKIVAQRDMDDRSLRLQRGPHIRYDIELFVFDRDGFRGVLGQRAARRHDRRDGLALPADAVDGDRVLRRRFQALQMRQYADPWGNNGSELLSGDDRNDAGQLLRSHGIDADDLRMGMRRAKENDMRHPRQLEVADILAASLHQPVEIGARHRLADVRIGTVKHGKPFGLL